MGKLGFSNNQLKIIAMISMTLDHVGVALFPQIEWLRIVGRLALPIYAFMIAEGCRHTRSMWRYFGSMALLAILCQLVYFFAMESLYMCILVTFSLSIALIGLLKKSQQSDSFFWTILLILGVCGAFFLCEMLPGRLPHTDFEIDYGFIGVMIPVCLYATKDREGKMMVLLLSLVCMATIYGGVQWWGLLAVPLLLLYNGRRGKWRMKWFFYFFYPVHLVAIYGISLLM